MMNLNIKQFGASGDGITLDHAAIQAAIDQCSESGGGTVILPSGNYLCGTVHLRSGVCLFLEMGAVIMASKNPDIFPEICKTPYGNLPGQIQALLWADDVENVTVTGYGVIDGGESGPLSGAQAVGIKFRPALIFYRNCKNVKFLDVTLQNSSFWTLHLMRCEDVMIRGVSILNNQHRINTDGIDPDGCRNVIISDCNIKAGDDCIVIKSTEGDVCENITVTNCMLSTNQAALKIGTEAIGDIRNITFNNCIIHNTDVALALYMKDGSTYENMIFSNMVIEAKSQFPILLDITPRYYKEPRKGNIRNIYFNNLVISGPGRCLVEGTKDYPVENITFENITWNVTGDVDFEKSNKPAGARRVELDPDRINYAANHYQFIAVNVDSLKLNSIKVYDRSPQKLKERGVLFSENVEKLIFENVESDIKIEEIKQRPIE